MHNFPNKFCWIWTLDVKVRALWVGLPDCVRTLFVPLHDEGLTSRCVVGLYWIILCTRNDLCVFFLVLVCCTLCKILKICLQIIWESMISYCVLSYVMCLVPINTTIEHMLSLYTSPTSICAYCWRSNFRTSTKKAFDFF